jgi:hypothetical protein
MREVQEAVLIVDVLVNNAGVGGGEHDGGPTSLAGAARSTEPGRAYLVSRASCR